MLDPPAFPILACDEGPGRQRSNSIKDDRSNSPMPALADLPEDVDRRSFLMRNAVIGAAAVMTGTTWTTEARAQQAAKEAAAPKLGGQLSPDLDVVKATKGPVMTPGRRVLQGRPRPLEFAHDRADAHHLRLLPALHEAAGRPTGARPPGSRSICSAA